MYTSLKSTKNTYNTKLDYCFSKNDILFFKKLKLFFYYLGIFIQLICNMYCTKLNHELAHLRKKKLLGSYKPAVLALKIFDI